MHELFGLITHYLTGNILFAIFLVAVTTGLVWKRKYSEAILLLLATGGTYITSFLLKLFFDVPRPLEALVSLDTPSFPSSHAAVSISLAICMLVIFRKYIRSQPIRIAYIIFWIAFAPVIGYSRLALGVHRPEELIAGYVVGAIVTILVIIGITKFQKRKTKV